MIRVLHVVTDMNRGGLETLLMNYYRHINRAEIQFDFLVHRYNRAAYDDEIESLGGKIYRLPRLNPFSIIYKRSLAEFFKTHPEYQIVHAHLDCMSSVVLKAAKECGVGVRIAHSHSSSQDKNLKYPLKLFFRHFIPKYATHLLACGELAGKWMFGNVGFTILNNAIDSAKYTASPEKRKEMRNSFGIKKNEFVLGHVGRFSPVKNHDFIIDIFMAVQKRINAKLLLVGNGKLKTKITNKVKRFGLTDKVIFTGIRNDVPDLLPAMDAFVFPSIYEGLPLTLIEAQAAGLPCFISSKVPLDCKITDLVQQIPLTDNAEIWADHIIQSLGIPKLNTRQKIYDAGFDICMNAKFLENYYKSL